MFRISRVRCIIAALLCVVASNGAFAQPVNDDCADAIPIGLGVTAYDTTTATTDGPAHPTECALSGDGGQTFNDIWFTWTAPGDGALLVTTCEQLGGSATYDTDLVVYDGINCGGLVLLACNDDDPTNPCGAGPNFHSSIAVIVTGGSDYLIRVGGWNTTDAGTGNLFVDFIATSGACCLPGGCMELAEAECDALGGTYQGDFISCSATDSDGDGVPDACDGCPNDTLKIAPGDCGCGEVEARIDASFDLTFGSSGDGNGQFILPFGIAVDAAGRIYVADTGNNRVQVFDAAGGFLFAFGTPGSGDGELNTPQGLTVDAAGRIYVSDTFNHRVQVFDNAGVFQFAFGSLGTGDGQFSNPYGIAVDPGGRIYVADVGNNRVQVFDAFGDFLFEFGSTGAGDGQFSFPEGIALDAVGRIYVADTLNDRVQVFDNAGGFLFKFGSTGSGDGQFAFPEGIVLDAAGRIYVADAFNNRVQVFDSAGGFQFAFGMPGSGNGEFQQGRGIAVDAAGRIYVADTVSRRVQVFDSVSECRGACCLSDLDSVYVGATACADLGGTFLGEGVAATVDLAAVTDGSFEGATPNAAWDEASTNFGSPLCSPGTCGGLASFGPASGDWYVWFGGIDTVAEAGSVEQSVTIPTDASRLSFQLRVPTASRNGDDFMRVLIDGNEVFRIQPGGVAPECGNSVLDPGESCDDGNLVSGDGCDSNCQTEFRRGAPRGSESTFINDETLFVLDYQEVVIDLIDAFGGPYNDGAAHTITLESETTGVGLSNFFVDDVIVGDVPCVDCPGDINGDLAVDLADLLAVISGWGTSYALPDLLEVISNWGNNCGKL